MRVNKENVESTVERSRSKEKMNATILFVDDEKNILSSLNRLFRPIISKVLTAESGADALDILERESVDIVISDMRMPEMDGAQFLEQVAHKWPKIIRILLTGYADITSTIDAINKGSIYRYISKPWEDNDIRLTVQHALQGKYLEEERIRLQKLTESQNKELQDLNSNLEEKVSLRTEEVRQTMGQLEVAHSSLKKNYVSTIKVFSNIIELHEGNDSAPSRNVADLSQQIAKGAGISDDDIQQIIFACLLRNIGRIGISSDLNTKSFKSLTDEEQKKVINHPVLGQGILMSLDYLQKASTYIRHQYEYYDGNGYPDKLKGKDIPVGARIITLAGDYYDLQSGLISSQKLSSIESLDYIKRNSSTQYDPVLVDILFDVLGFSGTTEAPPKVKKLDEIKLSSINLQEGMVLSRDLVMKNGLVLLAKGHTLTKSIILKVQKMENSVNEKMDVYIAK